MATDVTPNNGASVTGLVSGIIDDATRLMSQQLDLLKAEVRKDVQDAKDTAMSMAAAGALLGTGALLLSIMLAHLLEWAFRGRLELWGAFAIVGGVYALVGGILYYRAKQKLDHLNPLPEQTVKGVKENLQWKTNPS